MLDPGLIITLTSDVALIFGALVTWYYGKKSRQTEDKTLELTQATEHREILEERLAQEKDDRRRVEERLAALESTVKEQQDQISALKNELLKKDNDLLQATVGSMLVERERQRLENENAALSRRIQELSK